MDKSHEPPEIDKDAFTCPACDAFSAMTWNQLRTQSVMTAVKTATCHRCQQPSIWLDQEGFGVQQMLYPASSNAPLPNEDLPEECAKDYLEARSICGTSPRGAAALLRLCIQRLAQHLGGKGKNINEDIASLVKNDLPVRIQQALDVVRVIGNNAVHPGEISIEDQPKTVMALFSLVNLIVENQITQPRHVSELFSELPESAKEAVERRDSKT